MTGRSLAVGRLLLTSTLTASLLCGAVQADEGGMVKAVGSRFVALAPIGELYSLSSVKIDGRRISGEQILWGGELVSAEEASASAQLVGVGQVVLLKGSSARLYTSVTTDPLHPAEAVLTAVVMAGSVVISLNANSVAEVEVAESVVRSSRGSKFRIGILAGEASVEVERGKIWKEFQQARIKYKVLPAKLDSLGVPTVTSQTVLKVPTNGDLPIPVFVTPKPATGSTRQLEARAKRVAYQITPVDQPAVGIEVEFCLRNPAIGVITQTGAQCATTVTDQFGVAKVMFHAGGGEGGSKIQAMIVASNKEGSWEGDIEVFKPPPPWFRRKKNIVILAIVAAGGVVCIIKCQPRGPLRQTTPRIP